MIKNIITLAISGFNVFQTSFEGGDRRVILESGSERGTDPLWLR
jgi:hypothetical protein